MTGHTPERLTRGGFIAALGTGALALAPAPRAHGAAAGGDLSILTFALAVEHLQAAFYTEAERRGGGGALGARVAGAIGGIERAHVAALTEALGSRAAAPPRFDFGGSTADEKDFIRTAVALEDLAAAVHQGLLPRITSGDLRGLLASIHTVEAGHASWIRLVAGVAPVTRPLDDPLGEAEAVALLRRSGVAAPRAGTGRGDPWARPPGEGPELLAAFPLEGAPSAPVAAPAAPAKAPPGRGASDDLPWGALATTTAVVSTLVIGGVGLITRSRSARGVTVVGPDEGPAVSQRVTMPAPEPSAGREEPGVAARTGAGQTEPVSVPRRQRQRA